MGSKEELDDKMNNLHISPQKPDKISKTTEINAYADVPIKVAWNERPKIDLSSIVPPESPPILSPPAERPNVICHYSSCVSSSQPPQRTYAAPPGEEGLILKSVTG